MASKRLAAYDVAWGGTRDLAVYGEGVDWSPDGSTVLVGRVHSTVAALAGVASTARNWEIWAIPRQLHESGAVEGLAGHPLGIARMHRSSRRSARIRPLGPAESMR